MKFGFSAIPGYLCNTKCRTQRRSLLVRLFFIIFSMKKMEPLFSLSVLSFFYTLLLFLRLGGVKNQML